MIITAVCVCGERWTFEGEGSLTEEMDARAAVAFAVERGVEVRRYNEHVRVSHKRGR